MLSGITKVKMEDRRNQALWHLSLILREIAESHAPRIDKKQTPCQPGSEEKQLTGSEPRDNAYDGCSGTDDEDRPHQSTNRDSVRGGDNSPMI